MNNINGFLNIYKEQNYTSSDAVNIVRGIFGGIKTGHTGTLDPMAEGVLPVCLGRATKLADYVQASEKVYKTTLTLGVTSDTQDAWGNITKLKENIPDKDKITEAIMSFVGDIEQMPPMYSAIKINGKRLYELAREGKTATRKKRIIHIYDIWNVRFIDERNVEFTLRCSKGTYVRTLCSDIGEKLGCGGIMSSLKRLSSGRFDIDEAITLEKLKNLKEENRLEKAVIPIEEALPYPRLKALPLADRLLRNGNPVKTEYIEGDKPAGGESFLLYLSGGELAGIFTVKGDRVKPVCMLI